MKFNAIQKAAIILLLAITQAVFGNMNNAARNITGKVVSEEDGYEIPGVNIIIKGTSRGTISDLDGNFSLDVPEEYDVLVFSFVGYETKEVNIKDKSLIEVKLKIESIGIEDVVVTGYGTQKKSDVTGAAVRIRGHGMPGSASEVHARPIKIKNKHRKGLKLKEERASTEPKAEASPKPAEPVSEKPTLKIPPTQYQAGLLTACEVNDLRMWSQWKDLMTAEKYGDMQENWNMYPTDKISLEISSKDGKLLNNIQCEIKNNFGKTIWEGKSDIHGEIVCWPSLYEDEKASEIQLIGEDNAVLASQKIKKGKSFYRMQLDRLPDAVNTLDLSFVIDATGSMSDEIGFLKAELFDIIQKINAIDSNLHIRLSLTFYRDRGDQYVVRDFPFTSDINNALQNLNKQYSGGGGDYPEALDKGLEAAVTQRQWTRDNAVRILFVFADAPTHDDFKSKQRMHTALNAAARQGVKIIPVASSGIERTAEYLFRFMALATNGTYVYLTDHSGIGGPHKEADGAENQPETLNNLLTRLLLYYLGSTSMALARN